MTVFHMIWSNFDCFAAWEFFPSCSCLTFLAMMQAIGHAGELYKAVPKWCLAWEHRRAGLLAEIAHWQPDLLCLQEVDHWEDFQHELGLHG